MSTESPSGRKLGYVISGVPSKLASKIIFLYQLALRFVVMPSRLIDIGVLSIVFYIFSVFMWLFNGILYLRGLPALRWF